MEKLKILVFTHKKSNVIRDYPPYSPIPLGKSLHPELCLGYKCDNEGDNISEKNSSWNELTGIYWAWKNLADTEYIATCHYRRYFDVPDLEKNIDKYFSSADILVVKTDFIPKRNYNFLRLALATSAEDAWIFLDTLLGLHPEYEKQIKEYFFDNHLFFKFNMFIMNKNLFDEYCSFLFPVLFEVEKRIKEHQYSRQKRTIGYFGEWSLGVFILCKGLKFAELPWCCPNSENMSHTKPNLPLTFRKKIKRKITYWFELHRTHKMVFIKVPDDITVGLAADGIYLKNIK